MNELIKRVKEKWNFETDGEALDFILNVCDNIPYCDWKVSSIKEIKEEFLGDDEIKQKLELGEYKLK